MDNQVIAVIVGIISFIVFLFLAKNKGLRIIMAVAASLFFGTLTFLILSSALTSSADINYQADTPIGLTFLISAVLAITIFINDRFNYPMIRYASLLVLLVFSVQVSGIIFPGEFYGNLREGIALELLAGGFATYLIIFNSNQQEDTRHAQSMARVDALKNQIDRLDTHSSKTLHG